MASREIETRPCDEEISPLEQAMLSLMRAVLTSEEQRLLTVFDAITEPRVRQALLDVATAATNMTTIPTSDLIVSHATDDGLVRRIRRILWQRNAKSGGSHEP